MCMARRKEHINSIPFGRMRHAAAEYFSIRKRTHSGVQVDVRMSDIGSATISLSFGFHICCGRAAGNVIARY